MSTLKAKVILNSKTSSEWNVSTDILLDGEIGIESDTRLIKIGNGIDTWGNLPYTAISDISNIEGVTITSPTDGQVLTYSNGEWINVTPSVLPADTDLSHYDNTTSGFITASDIPALPADTDLSHYDNSTSDFATVSQIPTNVSQLNNDAGYITSSSIPTVNDGIITIQQNGSNIGSFTTNQSSNESINVTVPTNISAFNNDVGYLTSASLPSVNDGTLTIQQNSNTIGTFSANSAANSTINVLVPTKTSDLVNDSNFAVGTINNGTLTIQKNSSTVGTFSANSASNSTIDLVIPTDTSDLTNNAGFITNADLSGIISRLDVIEQVIFNKFTFTIDTSKKTGSTTFDFYYTYSDASTIGFFSVDWGDGNIEFLTAIGSPATIDHTYANDGVYHISVYSTPYDDNIPHFPYISFNNTQSKSMLISVDSPYPFINSSRTDFSQMFFQCVNLTTIPADLFKYNTSATSFYFTFAGCSNLTSIPADLFKYNTGATNFVGLFQLCHALTTIPADLFKYNTSATDFTYAFYYCDNVTSIPADLFKYNTGVTKFSQAFWYCNALTTIPAELFKYNTAATHFNEVFRSCINLTTIPAELFKYNTAATNFDGCFRGCTKLPSIPAELFKYNTVVTNFSNVFRSCNKVELNSNIFCDEATESATRFASVSTVNFTECFSRTSYSGGQAGTAPELWNYTYNNSPTTTSCFGGAGNSTTSLTNYNNIPSAWK